MKVAGPIAAFVGFAVSALSVLQFKLSALDISTAALEGKMKTLDAEIAGKMNTLESRVDGKISTLDGKVDGKISTLDGQLRAEVDGKINTLDGQLRAEVDGKISTVEGKINGTVENAKLAATASCHQVMHDYKVAVAGGLASSGKWW